MATAAATHSTSHLPLLSPPASDPPAYYAPSSVPTPTSTTTACSVRFQSPPTSTPRDNTDAQSLLPPYSPPTGSYKGYASQAEYLTALREWVEEKGLMAPGEKSALVGFYGRETMGECVSKNPRLRSWRGKGEEGRKGVGGGEERETGLGGQRVDGGRRKSSIGQWLRRKSTA